MTTTSDTEPSSIQPGNLIKFSSSLPRMRWSNSDSEPDSATCSDDAVHDDKSEEGHQPEDSGAGEGEGEGGHTNKTPTQKDDSYLDESAVFPSTTGVNDGVHSRFFGRGDDPPTTQPETLEIPRDQPPEKRKRNALEHVKNFCQSMVHRRGQSNAGNTSVSTTVAGSTAAPRVNNNYRTQTSVPNGVGIEKSYSSCHSQSSPRTGPTL